ncbi:arylamine N-acetyltransferase family protein [Alkalibacter mobilis]|uniref:arylamine N-acetyltransferase family protein n=1 Tax=Alkalibacter mobilis TaxID=2787712 RepID=UPI00189CBFD2|nr:arylamine N-acetyltransferase [Alkalibacter mobilis]MBF7096249.1 arylamine N-acetyltransferase [Alkalibacter mobilis]
MENSKFDLGSYLKRINFTGDLDTSADTLKKLHVGHVMNIPFENLDQLRGKKISLDVEKLFDKIVLNERGGYCFEMNGLFYHILKEIGFKVKNLFARVYRPGFGFSPKTHHVLVAEADGKEWLVDVGFGGNGPVAPVLLEEDMEQEQFMRHYMISKHPEFGYLLQFKIDGKYENVYAFNMEENSQMDYEIPNYFTSTHPDSIFTQVIMCTKATEKGRISIFDNNLKIVANGLVTEKVMQSDFEINEVLYKHFGLSLEDKYLEDASSR